MDNFNAYVAASNGLLVMSTVAGDQPSSRVMGFAQSTEAPNKWYLVTQPTSAKVAELDVNEKVAFVTLLGQGGERISSNTAKLVRSEKTWADVKHYFEENKGFMAGHPTPEAEIILELTFPSAKIASYRAGEEIVTF
jgi:general stress protein 26